MSWEHILLAIFAVGAVGAMFYFSMRSEPPPKKRNGKEPFFAARNANKDRAPSAAENESAPVAENESAAADSESPPPKTNPPPQGALAMEKFTPPELPPPDESLLPLDMCYAVRLFGEAPVAAAKMESLREMMRPAKSRHSHRLGFDEDARQWRLAADLSSRYWILAVPLADRGGAIDENDIRRMEESVRAFSQQVKMRALFPHPSAVLEDAARIDQFCATADMFIELRLSGDDCPPARIDEVMRLTGMIPESANNYVRRANSEELFRGRLMPVPASASRRTIIFEMDAPNISAPPRAFEEMMRAVSRAANLLEMKITDPKGGEVDEERVSAMRQRLSLLASQMREFGAEPGGAIARLIFS